MAGLLLVALLAAACGEREPDEEARLSGRELAELHCQGCHTLPEPALLDRESWRSWVLPAMGQRLGVYDRVGVREDSLLEPGLAGQLVSQAGIFPESPAMSRAAWERLVRYYLSEAPARLPDPEPRTIQPRLTRFRVRIPPFRTDPPTTSLVRIDAARGRIFVGDTKRDFSTLEILDLSANPVQTIGLESAPSHLRILGDSLDLLLTGRLLPTDLPAGSLRKVFRPAGRANYGAAMQLVDGLFRPVHASYADLNADGREDVVISEFGFHLGRLAWYEQTEGGEFRRHVLRALPGAITTFVRDVTGDGRPDIVALMAQGDEGVYLYENHGGRFTERRLLRFSPAHGSTWLDLADFDGDGHFDILYANGDAGDYASGAKPYHGVRIFLNDGRNGFREAFFFPLFGGFRAAARDFDCDGDLDIAAIAFYPRYERAPAESFVYLENRGGMRFEASTFPEADRGRWITFDIGDIDRDGDEDIVLGSFVGFDPTGDTTGLRERWLREGPSIVVLENSTR